MKWPFIATLCIWCITAGAAEPISLRLANGPSVRCEILKITKAGVQLKAEGGKEQTIPLEVLTPKEVLECYQQVREPFNAQLCLDMGAFFCKKKLFNEAEREILAAVKLDDKLQPKADELLKAIKENRGVAAVPDKPVGNGLSEPKDEPKKDEPKKVGDKKVIDVSPGDTPDDIKAKIEAAKEDFAARFKHQEVPERTPAQMKEFLDKRLEELNKTIGGTWRLIESKHYYCFANIPEIKHKECALIWNEELYKLLCDVLKHKDGDKLWNNKCPLYYFNKYSEFQHFAASIDGSPGAGNSGGYFSSMGRDVHICIPFMTQRLGSEKAADRQARSTLYHEGTHAFLQLSGEDVHLTRWLHEGLAQFIEFWFDPKNNPERSQRIDYISREIRGDQIPSWASMKERPQGGMDTTGYAWAWIKMEYLYRRFLPDKQKLPTMIRMIKSGKTEDEAMEKAFGGPVDKLETDFNNWSKLMSKSGFRFDP